MAIDKNKIKELLGSGLSNDIVADAVGVSPAYITQLLSDENFSSEVIALRTKNLTAANERDKKIDSIEDNLISQLSDAVEQHSIYKPRDLLSAFAVLNAARRRGVPAQINSSLAQKVISLQIPVAVVNKFTITSQGEVISVEKGEDKPQTLVTMPSSELLKSLSTKDSEHGSQYEKLQRYLPPQRIAQESG